MRRKNLTVSQTQAKPTNTHPHFYHSEGMGTREKKWKKDPTSEVKKITKTGKS